MKKIFFWILPVILSIFISLNFFWSKPLVPGFDAPFYLTEIKTFSIHFPNPLTYPYLDRYLTMAFPTILSKIFGFDPVTSYRLAISVVYATISFVLFMLFRNITKKSSTATILSSAIVISPFLINYSLLFANFTAFLILFSFFAVETGKNFKYKNILLGVIFGLIFYIHNFSTVSFGIIFATYYFLKFISTRDIKVIKQATVIFIVAAVIGFVGLARYLNIDLTFGHAVRMGTPTQPLAIGNEKKIILDAVMVYAGKFWLYYFAAFAFITLTVFRKQVFNNKKYFLIPMAIFIPCLILSFQPLYHTNYLPDRFATLVCLSTYFFYVAAITLPTFKKFIIPLVIMPLLLNYLSSDSLILNKGYRSFSDQEINVYKEVKSFIVKDGVILVPSDHVYWAQYYLYGNKVEAGEHFVSCGDIIQVGYLGEINFTFAKLLAETDIQKASVLLSHLKSILPAETIYILADEGLSCGHGKILKQIISANQIFNEDNWHLYEIN